MRRIFLSAILAAAVMWSGASAANPDVAKRYVPDARKIGDGVLTYLFWDVYRATLYAPPAGWRADAPFVLTLAYLRDLKGRDIAERTIEEIRDQGFADAQKLAAWSVRLGDLFPDVSAGDSLTAVRDTAGRTIFYSDARRIGIIEDPDFGPRFFDIWLGEKTSEPRLRRALLGG
tara:strand:+ start:1950 stop:2471 length:522 start_codon:yes stop_codon:yes gene_type:complete